MRKNSSEPKFVRKNSEELWMNSEEQEFVRKNSEEPNGRPKAYPLGGVGLRPSSTLLPYGYLSSRLTRRAPTFFVRRTYLKKSQDLTASKIIIKKSGSKID